MSACLERGSSLPRCHVFKHVVFMYSGSGSGSRAQGKGQHAWSESATTEVQVMGGGPGARTSAPCCPAATHTHRLPLIRQHIARTITTTQDVRGEQQGLQQPIHLPHAATRVFLSPRSAFPYSTQPCAHGGNPTKEKLERRIPGGNRMCNWVV